MAQRLVWERWSGIVCGWNQLARVAWCRSGPVWSPWVPSLQAGSTKGPVHQGDLTWRAPANSPSGQQVMRRGLALPHGKPGESLSIVAPGLDVLLSRPASEARGQEPRQVGQATQAAATAGSREVAGPHALGSGVADVCVR